MRIQISPAQADILGRKSLVFYAEALQSYNSTGNKTVKPPAGAPARTVQRWIAELQEAGAAVFKANRDGSYTFQPAEEGGDAEAWLTSFRETAAGRHYAAFGCDHYRELRRQFSDLDRPGFERLLNLALLDAHSRTKDGEPNPVPEHVLAQYLANGVRKAAKDGRQNEPEDQQVFDDDGNQRVVIPAAFKDREKWCSRYPATKSTFGAIV
jgi:hypothetical protein